ncbi:hypothetical protein ACOSQ3_021169 [Xanthoceras sorbifolium]
MQFCRPYVRQEPLDELTKRMKVKVSDFLGRLDSDAFQDWVIALEDYFDWFSVPEDRKVRFVKLKLKGPARVWWSSVEEQLRRTHQAPIIDWEEMKERLESMNECEQGAAVSSPRIPSTPPSSDTMDAILDHQFVSTRRGGYYKFLVRWATKPMSEAVWLQAAEIQRLNAELFRSYTKQNLPESSFNRAGN